MTLGGTDMAMAQATWDDCPGIKNDGRTAHFMRDGCTSCAPFWERIPRCPHCGKKLLKVGRTKCKGCKQFVMVGEDVR